MSTPTKRFPSTRRENQEACPRPFRVMIRRERATRLPRSTRSECTTPMLRLGGWHPPLRSKFGVATEPLACCRQTTIYESNRPRSGQYEQTSGDVIAGAMCPIWHTRLFSSTPPGSAGAVLLWGMANFLLLTVMCQEGSFLTDAYRHFKKW